MSQGQRAIWHDYKGVGFYMLTLATADRRPLFGHLVEPGDVALSPAGHLVLEAWRKMPSFTPQLETTTLSKILYRKSRYKSANVTPASPVDTRTAERTFARSEILPFLGGYPFCRACIHA